MGRIYCCQGRKKALKVCWAHSFSPVIKVELRLAYLCWEVSRDLWLVLTWVQISIYPSGRQFLIQPAPLRVSVWVVLMDTWWLLSQLRALASVGRGFENRWNFNLLEWTACPITFSSLMANDLSFVGVSRVGMGTLRANRRWRLRFGRSAAYSWYFEMCKVLSCKVRDADYYK